MQKSALLDKIIECVIKDPDVCKKISSHEWKITKYTIPSCSICGLDLFDLIAFDSNNKIKIICNLSCNEFLIKGIIE